MKNFLLQFSITLVVSWIVQLFAPWWSVVLVAAAVAVFFQYRYGIFSFLAAFTAVALLWLGVAYWINASHPDLADKISTILGGIGDVALLLITALLGGLSAGMGALTGTMGRKLVVN